MLSPDDRGSRPVIPAIAANGAWLDSPRAYHRGSQWLAVCPHKLLNRPGGRGHAVRGWHGAQSPVALYSPEFIRGVVDVRTDMYSLIATAYHAVTGTVPSGISGSIPQAQRINHAISPEFDAILTKGLRSIANQRYQRPSELRQDLLALRSVSG